MFEKQYVYKDKNLVALGRDEKTRSKIYSFYIFLKR